ncbi:penicillin-binding protein [Erythrobacter arachoides]|uniref:peptidoglycan glycosyltransferase n=1 Tax=Aurantiacibacter arachoides TaxID=1850444 RepID=A0A844ZY39_9SPHN|nr:transglycosylase domain-containing protein [Aurantiacibacter arachoides]MXO93053.1 penicillin-binding protein [Aurantiacibacter arachoides]GGD52392.1 penicillin-binding protein 1A [Aurantiacibacter arachoides]
MTEAYIEDSESGIARITRRIRRGGEGAWARVRDTWQANARFRRAAWVLGGGLLLAVIGFFWLTKDLPDAETLLEYEPNLPSVVRGIDGDIVHRFERERRVELQFQDFPTQLINAYTSAEDETFWTHGGIDIGGFTGAVIDYVSKLGSGERAVGGSTITQQVAKNILVGNEYSVTRKLREMVLATRIEGVLDKREIITLYLNEIPLGRRSFGVQAASRAYFDKDVDDLELQEMAFLAILPRAPEVYGRSAYAATAVERRDRVLDSMEENGHITAAQRDAAKAKPLGIFQGQREDRSADAGYFFEEVRRQLIARYGEEAEDGRNSVYAGGLWVRTSLDTELQDAAQNSLRAALLRYHGNRGWTGPLATLNPDNGDLAQQLASSYLGVDYDDWRVAVVTGKNGGGADIAFANADVGRISSAPDALVAGNVIAVSPSGNGWRLEALPEVSGGFLAMQPLTGRVMAMQGGFDSRIGDFNRATQAERQPGSTIKPFVYAAGLDTGMTPATIVPDRQYCYYQGANLGQHCFTNFGGERGGGEYPMRYGLEQSKNLMTMHIAMDAGMENVIETFERAGIVDEGAYEPYPSFALGAGDTTVERMVAAYSMLVNHGRLNRPSLIDFIQDRDGKVIWRADERECTGCNMDEWDGGAMPRFGPTGRQQMDPRTAFQVVHMLEGVVQRGTATRLRDLDIPLFGKTGTTNGPTNAWFVGGSPDIVAGTYIGFDQPRNLGGYVQGGNTAAPIFKQFVEETPDHWSGRPFVAPAGVRMVRIDRRSGRRVFDGWPAGAPTDAIIWEAFKPDTEPRRAQRQDDIDALRNQILAGLRRISRSGAAPRRQTTTSASEESFPEEQGGIY